MPRAFAIGPWVLDTESNTICRGGRVIRLEPKVVEVCACLAGRAGEVVRKEELIGTVWPDTFVTDDVLSHAISELRRALGDDARQPRFIETIPKRGYRMIALPTSNVPAVPGATQAGAAAVPATDTARNSTLGRWVRWAAVVITVAAAIAFAIWVRKPRLTLPSDPTSLIGPPAMSIVPFTSYPGFELCPAFSPDGSRIAFAWNRDSALGYKDFDLYVKVMGNENLLPLTHHPSLGVCPTWSPDGTQIGFIRFSASSGTSVLLISAFGGAEKQLLLIPDGASVSMPPVWSPDGKWIVVGAGLHRGDSHWIRFVSVDSGEVVEIPHAVGCVGEHWAAFSPSGHRWAYICRFNSEGEYGIFSAPSSGGPPSGVATLVTRFTSLGRPGGIAWTADDNNLLLSRRQSDTGYELDEVSIADGSLRKLPFGQNAEQIASSPHGDKLAFVVHPLQHIGIWRKDLLHPETAPMTLLASTQSQGDTQYSPDMKHIAFTSSRDGVAEIWMSDADGTNLSKLSDANTSDAGWPRWSPDSQKIIFSADRSGHWELYAVDLAGRLPHRLVCSLPSSLVASWSHDGKWIYLQGEADSKVYRCPATGGQAVALSAGTGLNPWESSDGKTLYFADRLSVSSIRMVPLQNEGAESELQGMPKVLDAGSWTVAPQGIYFVPADAPKSVKFFDFATRQVRPAFKFANFASDLAVSQDGRWITYTQIDADNADIMLVENFR